MNLRHLLILAVSTLSVSACTGSDSASSTSGAPTSSVDVSNDRSIDVSYSSDKIELSFARIGQPFRAMYARVVKWSNGGWQFVGYLTTDNANSVGRMVTGVEDEIELLDGANTDPSPDRYAAPGLPSGRYLICTTLVEPDNHNEVCGELIVS